MSRKIRVSCFLVFFALAGGFQPVLWASLGVSDTLMKVDRLKKLSPQEVVPVDTRSSLEFLFGHIPGAVNLNDWREFTETRDDVPGLLIRDRNLIAEKLRLLGIDYGKILVIYGDPEGFWRADGRFFWMFQYFGFETVFLLHGGYDLWVKEGGSVERGREKPVASSSLLPEDLRFNPDVVADQNWILQRLGSPKLVLVDNRDRNEFEGATPYGSRRGGHIPGAIHIDWRMFFTGGGLLKNREILLDLLKGYGIRHDQDIVVYCTGGVRSGMAYFVFRYLGLKVRNYDGSWWDWSRNLALPVGL